MTQEQRDESERKNILWLIKDLRAKGIDTTVIEDAHYIVLDEKTKGEITMNEQKTNINPKEARNAYLREWRKKNKEKVKQYQDRYWEKKAKEMREQQ